MQIAASLTVQAVTALSESCRKVLDTARLLINYLETHQNNLDGPLGRRDNTQDKQRRF